MSPVPDNFPASVVRVEHHVHENGVFANVIEATTYDRTLLDAVHAAGADRMKAVDILVESEVERLTHDLPEAQAYRRLLDRVRQAEDTETKHKVVWKEANDAMVAAIRDGSDSSPHHKIMGDAYRQHTEARVLIQNLNDPLAKAKKDYVRAFRSALDQFLSGLQTDSDKRTADAKTALARSVTLNAAALYYEETVLQRAEWWEKVYRPLVRGDHEMGPSQREIPDPAPISK